MCSIKGPTTLDKTLTYFDVCSVRKRARPGPPSHETERVLSHSRLDVRYRSKPVLGSGLLGEEESQQPAGKKRPADRTGHRTRRDAKRRKNVPYDRQAGTSIVPVHPCDFVKAIERQQDRDSI